MTTAVESQRYRCRVGLVTGASRGIGLAVAQRLVAEGGRVCLTARKPAALDEAVELLGGPQRAIAVAGSAEDQQHQAEATARCLEAFGRIDLLVNNTGVNPAYGPLLDVEQSAGEKIMNVNVIGALSWVRHVHRAWMNEHGGAIVNMASVAGVRPAEGIGFYGASKAALMHLTQQLARELGPHVRVNAIAPAVVKTRFAGPLYRGKENEVADQYTMKRLGTPDDVASAVAFMGSEDAAWVTGQTLVVDGGLMLNGGI